MKRASALAALVVAALALFVAPAPPTLGPATTGDPALAKLVRNAAGQEGFRGLSVALIEDGRVRYAGVGDTGGADPRPVDQDTAYELGSITKPMTGMLLADLASEGLSPDTPVRDLLPRVAFSDPAVAGATLAELSSHRAGIPTLRMTPVGFLRSYLYVFAGEDPYAAAGPRSMLDDAAAVSAGKRGEVSYSNLGAALLGQALAERAGADYETLLRTRLLAPLGMDATVVLQPDEPLPARHARGQNVNGLPMEPWRDHGHAGAGGAVWSTAHDVARLVQAVMAGSAPGADAATPRFDAGDGERIGYGWFTTRYGEREVTWHNGGTGGFRTYAGFDRASGRGVVVMGNTGTAVDGVGLRLLGAEPPAGGGPEIRPLIFALVFPFLGLGLLYSAFRAPVLDRVSVATRALWAVLFLGLGHTAGGWDVVPPFVWALGAGVLGAAVAAAVARRPVLPVSAKPVTWRTWLSPVIAIVLLAAFAFFLIG
ncbi:serine hydrolase [Nonomuraea sp. MCN248]|uniref:Serine hydrolase n=1 Tax=Nonomuraea corallina TaxID=2989783 RepID=A0ABT4S7L1_9ACTN|nr:serine hydrolase domain-containing protein [Nonomuraea corallina]MDA0632940.1 serine hydrolase [Nonomuraea corallina]